MNDLNIGSFTEDGPWEIDPQKIGWKLISEELNAAAQNEIDTVLEPNKIPPLFRTCEIIFGLTKSIGKWYLVSRRKDKSHSYRIISRNLKNTFQRFGPTYVKLGQIISSGEGIFPDELVTEFIKLRDQVPAEPFQVVRNTIESDLNRPLEAVFKSFNYTPIAAASIAQVYDATLTTGEEVVVKVQRSNIATKVRQDLEVMKWIAPFLVGRIPITALANPPALVEIFANTIIQELDFRIEANNMLDIANVLAETKQRKIVVPRPHPTLVTKRVLVMEKLTGFKWDDVEGMQEAGINTEEVLRAGMISFFEGAMFYGVFHGDLHGGNLFVDTKGRVALLDFGIVGRLNQVKRLAFMRLLVGALSNQLDEQIEALKELEALPKDVDTNKLIKELKLDQPVVDPTTLGAEEIIKEIQQLTKSLLGMGAKLPKELMLFAKNMLFLDSAIGKLAPNLDILNEIINISTYFATEHGERIAKEVGFEISEKDIDIEGIKASFGLTSDVESITYKEITERRNKIRQTFESTKKKS
jgi:ubiquinone biosynthesis protein